MPAVLEALQAVFPDLLPQELSQAVNPAENPDQSAPQSAAADTSSYESRIRAISSQFSQAASKHSNQQQYLETQKQHATAAADAEALQADIAFTPGWRKTGLPVKASHLTLNHEQMAEGGLVDPKTVLSQYGEKHGKEVLSLLPDIRHAAGADPHYCSTTSNLQVRNKLVPEKRKAEAGQGTTWRALPQEDLQARLAASAARRRAMTQTMPKDQWDLEKKIIRNMHHKLTFLRNPRFPSPDKHSRGLSPEQSAAELALSPGGSQRTSAAKVLLAVSCVKPPAIFSLSVSLSPEQSAAESATSPACSQRTSPAKVSLSVSCVKPPIKLNLSVSCAKPPAMLSPSPEQFAAESLISPARSQRTSPAKVSLSVSCVKPPAKTSPLPEQFFAESAMSPAGSQCTLPAKSPRAGLPQVPFRAEPEQVVFQEYLVGEMYQQSVQLHNCTSLGQRLRLLPYANPHFLFSGLAYATQSPEPGLIAPGMHVTLTVYFTPTSLVDITDALVLETGQGALQVPLLTRRFPPRLSLPKEIAVGPTIIGNKQIVLMTCSNSGGAGHFCVVKQQQAVQDVNEAEEAQLGPFCVSPAQFALDREESLQIQIAYRPEVAGSHDQEFVLACDNGTSTVYKLSGTGAEVDVQLTAVNGRQLTDAEAGKPVWFGQVAVGASQQRVVRIENRTPVPLPFCWQQTDNPILPGSQHAQRELADGQFGAMQFHVEPAVGVLEAGAVTDIAWSFIPGSQHRFLSWAQLFVDTAVPGTNRVPSFTQSVVEIGLEGFGGACQVAVWPPIINCPGLVQLGQVVKQSITVSNPSKAPAHIQWTSLDSAITVQPASARVLPNSEQQMEVLVKGTIAGKLRAQLTCSVTHGTAHVIEVTAAIAGPKAEFQDAGLNFGLVQHGTQVTQQITIQNPSLYAQAAWSLCELRQPGSSTEPVDLNLAAQHAQHGAEMETAGPADLNNTAQHAQQGGAALPAGVPAALQVQAKQLLQQLHAGDDAAQEAEAEAAADRLQPSAQTVVAPKLEQQLQSCDAQTITNTAAVDWSQAQQALSAHEIQLTDASAAGKSEAELSAWMSQNESAAGMASNPFEGSEEEQQELNHLQIEESWGVLDPGASRVVQVVLYSRTEGVFNSTLELSTAGGAMSHLSVTAAVIAPSLALTPAHLDLGVTNLGVPRVCHLTMSNLTMLPTSFSWEGYNGGAGQGRGGQMAVIMDPSQGVLEPGAQLPLQATFTPTAVGQAETLVACCTSGSNPPAGFSAVSHVKGLTVTYAIRQTPPTSPNSLQATSMGSLADSQTDISRVQDHSMDQAKARQHVKADFGDCSIGENKSLELTITNQTLIEASVSLWLESFQADHELSTTSVALSKYLPSTGRSSTSKPLSTVLVDPLQQPLSTTSASLSTSPVAAPDTAHRASSPLLLPGSPVDNRFKMMTASLTSGSARNLATAGNLKLGVTSDPLGDGMSAVNGVTSRRGHKGQSIRGVTLTNEAERTRPFASALGQSMMTQRTSQAAAKQVVGDKGIAIGMYPHQGSLTPGGSFTCTLHCSTGLPGDYVDTLHVQIGDLPEKKIPVHISVLGSPLIMQLDKLLLPGFPRNPAVPQPPALLLAKVPSQCGRGRALGLFQADTDTVPAGLELNFGQLLAETAATRTFFVFNTAHLPVQVDWVFHRYGLPGPKEAQEAGQHSHRPPTSPPQPLKVLAVHFLVDEGAESVSLSTSFVANPADQPFRADPSTALIAGNSSVKVTVHFSSPDAMMHNGYFLGTHRLVSPDSHLKLHCCVEEEFPPVSQSSSSDVGQTDTGAASAVQNASEPAATAGEGSPPLAGANLQEQVREGRLVTCQISGGFHAHAGASSVPLQPLRVNLNAAVIQPYLEPEFPDGSDSLSFLCHATNDPAMHPSYRQTAVLTNMHSCPLQFSLSLAGAEAAAGAGQFRILRVVCSSVTKLEGLQPKPLLSSLHSTRGHKQPNAAREGSTEACMLRPYEHVTVTIHYTPQQQHSTGPSTSDSNSSAFAADHAALQPDSQGAVIQDESARDQLIMTYSNGYQQAVPINAQLLHPIVHASAAKLDFGAVHVLSPKTLELELSNPSAVEANWTAQIAMTGSDPSAAASVSFAQTGQLLTGPLQAAQRSTTSPSPAKAVQSKLGVSSTFLASPSSALLPGRGLGMPKKQILSVTFCPKQAGLCTAELQILLPQGNMCHVALSGVGTFSQNDETHSKLMGI